MIFSRFISLLDDFHFSKQVQFTKYSKYYDIEMIEKLAMGFWIITFLETYAWQMTSYWSNTAYLNRS